MAHTYTNLIFHVVFSTEGRVKHLTKERRSELFAYSHKPFLHRMRFGSDPGNGSYYLDVEFDTNDTVVAVRSGNF